MRDFPPTAAPPLHMAIAYGPVRAVQKTSTERQSHASDDLPDITLNSCSICLQKLKKVTDAEKTFQNRFPHFKKIKRKLHLILTAHLFY